MAASTTAILNTFQPLYLPYFPAEFDKTCIKINGLLSTLLQDTLTAFAAFHFNTKYIHKIFGCHNDSPTQSMHHSENIKLKLITTIKLRSVLLANTTKFNTITIKGHFNGW